MAQIEELRRTGHWLFRWRSFLPLLTIILFPVAMKDFTYPDGSHLLDGVWDVFCIAFSLLGFGVRVYTVGHAPNGTSGRITSRQRADVLNTTGMYSVVRHPLYLGNFLIWLGISLFVRSFFFSFTAVLLFFLYYERIIFVEEEYLRGRFGRFFIEWAEKTPTMIPRFRNWQKPSLSFSLKTVLKRESSTFLLIIVSFTCLEVLGDFFYKHKWQISLAYVLLFSFGLVVFVVLRIFKKKHLLDVEGR